jgi:hypothetical protein
MVLAFMGLTSSRDVTVSGTLATSAELRPTYFLDHRPDRLSTCSLLPLGRSPAGHNPALE